MGLNTFWKKKFVFDILAKKLFVFDRGGKKVLFFVRRKKKVLCYFYFLLTIGLIVQKLYISHVCR